MFRTIVLFHALIQIGKIHAEEEDAFGNHVFIFGCTKEESGFETEQVLLLLPPKPRLVVDCGSARRRGWKVENSLLSDGVRYLVRFFAQRFTHTFLNFRGKEEELALATLTFEEWKERYGLLTLSKEKLRFFQLAPEIYPKYPHHSAQSFLEEYYKSQWNQDRFIIDHPTSDPQVLLSLLREPSFEHLPSLLQKEYQLPPERIDPVFYSPLSGWGGSQCVFYTLEERIVQLTNTYNAYDTLFCDTAAQYNVSLRADYNFGEFFYMRHFVLRDDLMSSFPPDPNALFYESPGVTFIVLKDEPILWGNILRPFDSKIWAALTLSLLFILGFNSVIFKLSQRFIMGNAYNKLADSYRMWYSSVRIVGFLFLSSYSAMILAGYLFPNYPWTPRTFRELNGTNNFYGAIPQETAITRGVLLSSSLLSGLGERWHDHGIEERTGNGTRWVPIPWPGIFFPFDKKDRKWRYAVFLYSDKVHLYTSAKQQLETMAHYYHGIEADNEVVRKEMRYVSVAPGATKLQFLVDGMRRNFESGVWIRWKLLEENYFKYVAPTLIRLRFGVSPPTLFRPLRVEDVLTTLALLAFLLILCLAILLIEVFVRKNKKDPVKVFPAMSNS